MSIGGARACFQKAAVKAAATSQFRGDGNSRPVIPSKDELAYGATHSPINTCETGSLYRFLRLQLLSIPISISASRRWRKTKESRVVRRTAMDDGNRAEGTRSERKSVGKKPISMEMVNQPSGHLCN